MKLIPKNWVKFQHYKDRNPPWIKLHRDLLIDKEFMRLPLASKALAPMLWLLASEDVDGIFEADIDQLEFRLRLSQKELKDGLKPLIDNGFFLDASTMLAVSLQDAIPETETEKRKRHNDVAKIFEVPNGVDVKLWGDFLTLRKAKNLPITETALNGIIKESEKAGITLSQTITICCERGWGGFKAAWIQHELPKKLQVVI